MIEAVLPSVCDNGVIQPGGGEVEKGNDPGAIDGFDPGIRRQLAAVLFECGSELVEHGSTGGVIDAWLVEECPMFFKGRIHFGKPVGHATGQMQWAIVFGKDRLQDSEVATQVARGHHRKPVSGEGVVGVVPFRPLGVHPHATVGHEG